MSLAEHATRRNLFATFLTLVLVYWLFMSGSSHKVASNQPLAPPKGAPSFKRTIVAVGDLHGDYENMMEVLKMSGAVAKNGTWSGNVDYLVQTGDIIDRGDEVIKMYRYIEGLRGQARAHGGDVRSHLGNHEVMNLIGDWRFVPPAEISTFGGIEARQKLLSTGWIGAAWRANYSVTTRLPLHPSLGAINIDYDETTAASLQDLSHAALSFCHGGLSPTYSKLTPYPSSINDIGSRLVARLQDRKVQPKPHPPHPYAGLPKGTTAEEVELYEADGPLWYRGWAMDKEVVACKAVDNLLKKIGVRRLIMGHTPHFSHILSRCDGKIILIDTGISHAYGGILSAAKFTYTLWPSKTEGMWIARDLVTAIYPDGEDVLVDDVREIRANFL
ncbi:hypothetical protein FRB95_010862 [Tulasnella sp. JGI-2019a]|nr:hypothetical protein FRB93_013063 [Tulasnella sp. JGI-2019a]KAG9024936.1 hypothetical protein FRB95_010862 [Tulasnella sp. JGI-2019a]